MVELALTMKVKLTTNKHESEALNRLCDNYTSCCNEVSDWIENTTPSARGKSTRLSITRYATNTDCWPR